MTDTTQVTGIFRRNNSTQKEQSTKKAKAYIGSTLSDSEHSGSAHNTLPMATIMSLET